MFNKCWRWVCLLGLNQLLIGQIASAIDTIHIIDKSKTYYLSNQFILESSFHSLSPVKLINPITGQVKIDSSKHNPLIVHYDYLKKGLPLVVKPHLIDLSIQLDTLNTQTKNEPIKVGQFQNQVYSTGSLYRQLSLNPIGGSEFSGGLNLQLNGQLSDNIMISGVLTDQELPIQPEGVTQRLDELDKVLISISHPNVNVDAGDIIYKDRNIRRKLIGLKNRFNTKGLKGSSVYGGSKGQIHILEMKGRDGDQGPYQLVSKNGSKDIVVLAGTEKVWLNGAELIRGQRRDYTIDYALAEIKFTPKHLIHGDSDILIEFEYSDFQYQKGLVGGSLQNVNQHSKFTFGFYSEKDQFNSSMWSRDLVDSLEIENSDYIRILSAKQDSTGDYLFVDGVFIYDSTQTQLLEPHYRVTFESSPTGEYIRKISNLDRIYYHYVGPQDVTQTDSDLYSPYRTIQAPNNHQQGYLKSEFSVGPYVKLFSDLNLSVVDKNIINPSLKSSFGKSHQFEMIVDSLQLGNADISIALTDWVQESEFSHLGRTYEPNHSRFWNLDSIKLSGFRESSIAGMVSLHDLGQFKMDLSQYSIGHNSKERLHLSGKINNTHLTNSFVDYFNVNDSHQTFRRLDSRLQINHKTISPFLTFLDELKTGDSKFSQAGIGFRINRELFQIESGYTNRKDESWNNSDSFTKLANDHIGFLNIAHRTQSGWNNHILIQNRIKTGYNDVQSMNYSLAQLDIGFNSKNHPMNLKLDMTMEKSFSELRAVVYDSIGPGLGQYRYDSDFNDYILDPNGEFISYTITTGERKQTTEIYGVNTISFDLGKLTGFPEWLLRWNSRVDLKTSRETSNYSNFIDYYFNPNLVSIVQSRFDLISSGKNRMLGWVESRYHLNGLDPRGQDINDYRSIGIHWDKYLTQSTTVFLKSLHRKQIHESQITSLRNRSTEGQWHDIKIQWKRKRITDLSIGLLSGWDKGKQHSESFFATGIGLQFQLKHFFNKNALIQVESNFLNVFEANNQSFLPPEALNGFTVGKSVRQNARFQYILNRSMTVNLSVQRIDDSRYSDLINFQGEIRAHF